MLTKERGCAHTSGTVLCLLLTPDILDISPVSASWTRAPPVQCCHSRWTPPLSPSLVGRAVRWGMLLLLLLFLLVLILLLPQVEQHFQPSSLKFSLVALLPSGWLEVTHSSVQFTTIFPVSSSRASTSVSSERSSPSWADLAAWWSPPSCTSSACWLGCGRATSTPGWRSWWNTSNY